MRAIYFSKISIGSGSKLSSHATMYTYVLNIALKSKVSFARIGKLRVDGFFAWAV